MAAATAPMAVPQMPVKWKCLGLEGMGEGKLGSKRWMRGRNEKSEIRSLNGYIHAFARFVIRNSALLRISGF
jgi:hypothetical protein